MNPLSTSIACAVLQPALRSLLIFDAPFTGLEQIAQLIVTIAAQAGQHLRPIIIGSTEGDDDLWGERILPDSHGTIKTYPQIFSPPHESTKIPLIIIPDLSALSLAAARTCTMLVGANVAHLERHGQKGVWSPRYYWLASCPQEAVGSVSPHLLDRFALRLSWRSTEHFALSQQERARKLLISMQQEPPATLLQLDPVIMQSIKQAAQHPPLIEVTAEACELIMTYQEDEVFHQRRELALARCALTLAQLEGASQLLEAHVEQAAELMGLQPHTTTGGTDAPVDRVLSAVPRQEKTPSTSIPQVPKQSRTQPDVVSKPIEVQEHEPHEQRTIDYVMTADNPYPEDTEPILREAASLQIPPRHYVNVRSDRGPIIGVEPSTTLRDLALVNTVMKALLFQAFRPKSTSTKIVLDWTDLRKYRRAAEPERLLLLLLDYTSISLAQRQQALVPYLSQAYIERAGITIIKVGVVADSTKSGLQAESVSARSILVPAISEAIDAPAGNATPLAHGLELALQIIQRTLQHGRSTVQHITFVVVSDGRGNVPLQASQSNIVMTPAARVGVADALEKAQEIGKIRHVETIVLFPRLRYYQELPQRLANALNARLILIEDEFIEAEEDG